MHRVILFSTFMTKYAACRKMSPDTWKISHIPEEGHFGLASPFESRQQLLQRTSKRYWMHFDHSYIALFNNWANLPVICICRSHWLKIDIQNEKKFLSEITVRKEAKIRNRVPHLKCLTWEKDKNTRKHHTLCVAQENQEVFLSQAARNRQDEGDT